MKPTLPPNTVILNDNRYEVNVTLLNTNGSIPLPHGLIKNLIIYDNLYSIFYSGKLVIDNSSNTLENFANEQYNELKERIGTSSYAFNTDNNDRIIIDIVPVTPNGPDESAFPSAVFRMRYLFAVYNEQEYTMGDNNDKSKVFYLRDARAQELHQTNIQWSTADTAVQRYKHRVNANMMSDKHRSVPTGFAIADLITKSLPTFSNLFDVDWDKGLTDIFHTSLTQNSAFDDIEAILDHHISHQNRDNCILRYDQRRDMWTLKSFHDIFSSVIDKQAGKFGTAVTDAFNLHGSSSVSKNTVSLSDKTISEFSGNKILAQQLDGLTSYQFQNTANDDGINEIVSNIVHSYNKSNKQFNIDCNSGYIDNVQKEFQRLYADPMAGESPTAVFPTNDDKKLNLIRNNTYDDGNLYVDRLKSGVNRTLSKALAYSPAITFTTNGSTHRIAGNFLVVTGSEADSGTSFSKLLFGEWLLTNVTHVFMFDQEEYKTTLSCVKPHTYGPII